MSQSAPHDVVGHRVLVGVQMIDISRLSAHPVPLTHRGLITVAGQGPKDSNGAGKSSFIAALSLLHADEQWRLAGGAPAAAELLFTAELAAQEARWANADHGYVIGVFADPAATDLDTLESDVVTVWLRINRKAPYLSLRWTSGLHLPSGSHEAERAAAARDLWAALPSSNGRDDIHAGRLSGVLYGGQVRCVSFLSTSVRATSSANLLAQPLNELSPYRIFEALAMLTGLDRELEQEQALRSAEHNRRREVLEAETELARWQTEMDVVEAGIARRIVARAQLTDIDRAWRSRCARQLVDASEQVARLRHTRATLRTDRAERAERIAEAQQRIRTLRDDDEFQARFRAVETAWRTERDHERELEARWRRTVDKLDELGAARRELAEQVRTADGRDVAQAQSEQQAAQTALEDLLAARGAALAEQQAAHRQPNLTPPSRHSGRDLLGQAGITAVAVSELLPLEQLPTVERSRWAARLRPYRDALVVASADAERAAALLSAAPIPAGLLVVADPVGAAPGPCPVTGPDWADDRFPVGSFLTALAARAGQDVDDIDLVAGIRATPEPLAEGSGRDEPSQDTSGTTTTAQAPSNPPDRAELARSELERIEQRVARARAAVRAATERVAGAHAADRARELAADLDQLRGSAQDLDVRRTARQQLLEAAETARAQALGDQRARQDRVQALTAELARLDVEQHQNATRVTTVEEELARVDLATVQSRWGGTVAQAEQHLVDLPEPEQARSAADWAAQICVDLDDVVRRTFGESPVDDELPAEVRDLLVERRWRRLGWEARAALAPDLSRALHNHLARTARQDEHDHRQIDTQREQRTADLAVARSGLAETEHSAQAHRTVLAQAITAVMTQVAGEFDRLDRAYGGYGAGLVCPVPLPPADPDKPWRWAVTPTWKRAEGQRMSGYHLRGNTAQLDEKAVKLVCAAALAGGQDRPLLLILDELGRNLGRQHRREAVALFEQIGRDRNITVIGALQDDMERYAIEASNLYIKLRRSSDAIAYNEAPVVVGDDANRARVTLLAEWLSTWRRPAPRADAADILELPLPLPVDAP